MNKSFVDCVSVFFLVHGFFLSFFQNYDLLIDFGVFLRFLEDFCELLDLLGPKGPGLMGPWTLGPMGPWPRGPREKSKYQSDSNR